MNYGVLASFAKLSWLLTRQEILLRSHLIIEVQVDRQDNVDFLMAIYSCGSVWISSFQWRWSTSNYLVILMHSCQRLLSNYLFGFFFFFLNITYSIWVLSNGNFISISWKSVLLGISHKFFISWIFPQKQNTNLIAVYSSF